MIGARGTFKDLHEIAGHGFAATDLPTDLAPVARRIARRRAVNAAALSVAGIVVIGAAVFGLLQLPRSNDVAPAITTSIAPDPTTSVAAVVEPECRPATVVEGKPVDGYPADEDWFNPTPDYLPCDRWQRDPWVDLSYAAHPDLVVINTVDNTMVRAYYRTSIDALGVYGHLGDGFVIPDPDPTWPPNAVVVVDAVTGEPLANLQLPGHGDPNPDMFTWADWWAQYLGTPLAEVYLPDGYRHKPDAAAPAGSENDVVAPQTYEAALGEPSITIRLVAGPVATPPGSSVVDGSGYPDGSALALDDSSGVYTLDIPVPDDLHVLIAGGDLDVVRQFVDALTTVEQG